MGRRTIDFLSKIPFQALREFPREEQSSNSRLLLRAGFISKTAAGIFSFLPLGMRVLQKIEEIVREEMRAIDSSEVLLPALHPRELWNQTNRWDEVDVLFKTTSRTGGEYCMGPTHEEIVTPLASELLSSYRDLPFSLFQIQTKFRDEPRPRSGLLRGKEFRMKDMYSFHSTQSDLEQYYAKVTESYRRIFDRVGIGKETLLTFASGGMFSQFSHEFQLLAPSGEDSIFVAPELNIAINKEIVVDSEGMRFVFGDSVPLLEEHRGIEVGNIFQLGTRFSDAFDLSVTNQKGEKITPVMGCYGLGTSRLLGAIAEIHNDERGLTWPVAVAPYEVHVTLIPGVEGVGRALEEVIAQLKNDYSLLVDDRPHVRPGEKFADADLIGVPFRIVLGKRACEHGEAELSRRKESLREKERRVCLPIHNLNERMKEITDERIAIQW
jgi:prolyl-tRNA synthetase